MTSIVTSVVPIEDHFPTGASMSPPSCQHPVTDVLSLGTTYLWSVESAAGLHQVAARARTRRKWRRNWTPLGKPRPWPRTPEEETIAAESHTQLAQGLAELPERQRSVVALRDIHGLSSEEVSSLLGLSVGNQRVLLHRDGPG